MSLGAGAYKVGGAGQCSSTRKEISFSTLQAAPTRHCHIELYSGILTNQYLVILGPELKREGRVGKNTEQKWQASNKAIANTLCKELQARNCVYRSQSVLAAPAGGIGPPPS